MIIVSQSIFIVLSSFAVDLCVVLVAVPYYNLAVY